MNGQQADCILKLLDYATDGNWPQVATRIVEEAGYSPAEVSGAWKALEEIAGVSGGAPEPADF